MSTSSGFAFSGRGRVDRVETFTSKAGKEIVTLVIQVEGQYPQLVPVKFFGRVGGVASRIGKGADVEITGKLGGREWSGKVYGDIIGDTVEEVGGGHADGNEPKPPDDDSDSGPF